MTPRSIEEQANALGQSVGVRARDDLRVVRLRGDDQRSWLNGQLTNDVRHTRPGDGVYCLAVNVRGKIIADVWVLDADGELIALLPAAAEAAVLSSFESQIIMEDVELAPDAGTAVLSVQGPGADTLVAQLHAATGGEPPAFRCDELGSGGRVLLVSAAERDAWLARADELATTLGGARVEDEAFELARLRAGWPRFGRDFGDKTYPQEAGLKQRAVSFNKGCYLGQEVVCTLENRGRLSRRLARLELIEGEAAPGDELFDAEGKKVGALTSLVADPALGHSRALGYVKSAAATPGGELTAGPARLIVRGLVGESD